MNKDLNNQTLLIDIVYYNYNIMNGLFKLPAYPVRFTSFLETVVQDTTGSVFTNASCSR